MLPSMIPLKKLFELPRSQRLRKAANLVRNAQRRFFLTGIFTPDEAEYFGKMAEMLAGDGFCGAAAQALVTARSGLTCTGIGGTEGIRRALNAVYNILLNETGRYQADWDFIVPSGTLDTSKRRPFPGMQVYLEDIRSPFNVGSMFRAAESFGAEKLWLSPLCADPRHKRAERTAMGCVDVIPWERFSLDPFAGQPADRQPAAGQPAPSDRTQAAGWDSCCHFSAGPFFTLETGGIPLADFPFPSRGIMIAGSEELAVSPPALAAADASLGRVTIQTYGAKGSLNVSVAFGIVMQAWAAALRAYP